ncbi:hypothetical protein F2Q68_00032302 [Brassica cretica]|uniref:Uncharacterized protein n=1 Tax=Brassica cretica TaxID=69181 RepID=A0A8S9GLR2_BRACR|nr:hypothetical protein F2Q68_00032302 [Brassica cretica]
MANAQPSQAKSSFTDSPSQPVRREHFHSFILPKLELSLSLALRSYLPLSGRITWDTQVPKPSILLSPNDAVSVTIAETRRRFFSPFQLRIHTLIPELPFSDDSASAYSLQITLFPGQGFSIGVAAHHGVLDGKNVNYVLQSMGPLVQIRKHSLDLTPSLHRSLLNDLTGLDEEMLEIVRDKTKTRRSLRPEKSTKTSFSQRSC